MEDENKELDSVEKKDSPIEEEKNKTEESKEEDSKEESEKEGSKEDLKEEKSNIDDSNADSLNDKNSGVEVNNIVIDDTPELVQEEPVKKKDITKVLTSDEMPQFVKEATVKPKKNIKRILIFASAIVVLVGLAIFLVVLYLNSKETDGAKSPGKIAYVYMEAFNNDKNNSFDNYISNDCPNREAFINQIESGIKLNKAYILQFDEGSASVVIGNSYSSDERKKKLEECGYKKNKAEDMKDITLVTEYTDLHGVSNAGTVTFIFTVMRASGTWYLVDIMQGDVVNYSAPVSSDSDATVSDASVFDASMTDAIPLDKNGLKDNLFCKEIKFDGKKYQMPFDYSKISKDYTFSMEDYGYDDDYSLSPGDLITGTIQLSSEKMDDDVSLWVGFTNTSDKSLEIKKCKINSLRMDIRWASDDKYPELMMPSEITFGSSIEDIVKAYGEPSQEPYRAEELGYWSYTYSSPYHDYNVEFVITDDVGVTEISIRTY